MSYDEPPADPSLPIPSIGEIVADAPEVSSFADDDAALADRIIAVSAANPAAYLEEDAIAAFTRIREADPAEYETLRMRLKQANRAIRVTALDKLTCSAGEANGVRDSLASQLTDLAAERCELWHDADGNGYASFDVAHDGGGTHREHWPIESRGCREWLGRLCHTELDGVPASEVIKATCNALIGKAKFDGEEHEPAKRVGRTEAGYWLDLCDEGWRAMLITAAGWTIREAPEPRFVRSRAMRPLPHPVCGGSLDALWTLLNIPEEERGLLLAWVIECYRCDTPYPVLELVGEQGSAKSTAQETLRTFIDPNKVMLRGRPKSVEDVYVAAGANHVVSMENLSGISPEISDALCTIATGGGAASRQLYTNGEEHIIEAHNPVMLNGIGAVITRSDLLDRAIAICLPKIEQRMTEAEHGELLNKTAGEIMGALLDLFVRTLAKLPTVRIDPAKRPRMADFAMLGEAMHQSYGGTPGAWLERYVAHRQEAVRRTIDASPVAAACLEFVAGGNRYAGTVKGLLERLNSLASRHSIERGDYWPKSPKGLADALRRAAPALRQLGVHVEIDSKPKRDGVHCELRQGEGYIAADGANNGTARSRSSPYSRTEPDEEVEL
ncbi:MAG: hypothetical protein FAZ92_00248 [Accumulibacter sp.]|uniref:hypothetical protein n=1 Tax=Accumulibacter sp. TaxID=2053492 RepID=UPI0012223732|nr:hypothetical protein [Accumulibacter sp.]QKS27744.1 MAG: hypothetical protein HT579_01455 [Candidatus Accumulibacter similis]TLD47470.1 MAG: hypothetical protein FAZ92_00248 [Accumulibacter sp.]